MILLNIYDLLKRIHAEINHNSVVTASFHDFGLELRAEIICTKLRQKVTFSHVFSPEELRDIADEAILVNYFIEEANARFRQAYKD